MESTSITVDYSQYGGGGGNDDDRSMGASSIGMASKTHNDESFMATTGQFNNTSTQDGTANNNNNTTATNNNNNNLVIEQTEEVDPVTAEAENAVTKERTMLYKENAAKLQQILENIKNSTKNILREMDAYLQETEEVEKTFIRCRANTQKESQRMEQVEPDVIAATQRFMAQGAQLFGGGGGSSMNFMNMLMGSGGGGPMGMTGATNGMGNNDGMAMAAVTPRESDASSMVSSMAGSMHG